MNSDYSLAVHSLTLLSIMPDRMSSSSALAESASVHPVRIRKVLSMLRQHGLVETKEGTGGGFILSAEPDQVTLWEIYQITSEGSLQPKCSEANKQCLVGANMELVLSTIFTDAESHLGAFLQQYSIADMVNQVQQHSHSL
ncbi:Rrf2 family transcriptional regulator [Gracilibacillus sp. YIM 98692]|uniref:RrF2 family transcriptional regulator n=1 Tax=Gracilibacillus sp. YIM 98692 TaxID=2663532 RepID=UPI0013CFD412|nr:Rrf2 family transcriptional regulator [Gracilibacillus sp. YIM 98692]